MSGDQMSEHRFFIFLFLFGSGREGTIVVLVGYPRGPQTGATTQSRIACNFLGIACGFKNLISKKNFVSV